MKLLIFSALAALVAARPGNGWENVPCPTVTEWQTEYVTQTVVNKEVSTVYLTSTEVEYKTETCYETITAPPVTVTAVVTQECQQKTWGDW